MRELPIWENLPADDVRFRAPDDVTAVPVDPQIQELPTNLMTWPNFEKLLLRIAREVQGLRSVRLYGVSGQKQDGIDLIGINPAAENEAVQAKKYQSFSLRDLNAAVDKYLDGSLPFRIVRLAIGVSCTANETALTARLLELNQKHVGIEFEIWDQGRISEMLRDRPNIVREFFGEVTAARFCSPYEIVPLSVPSSDAVALADAVMQGPLQASGAAQELMAAGLARDPGGAVTHVANAQQMLRRAGFTAHAQSLDVRRATLLKDAGNYRDAALMLANRIWEALDEDATYTSQSMIHTLDEWAKELGDEWLQKVATIVSRAFHAHEHPLGAPPAVDDLDSSMPREMRARLLLLAGEATAALGEPPFDACKVSLVAAILSEAGSLDELVKVRLELCVAQSTDEWTNLLERARKRQIPRQMAALVLARHAQSLELKGNYEGAQSEWSEAVEQACLSNHNNDAARWLLSQRMLATRTSPSFEDPYWPVASALRRARSEPAVVPLAAHALESALISLEDDKDRPAAICLQRVLRDGVASADSPTERDARVRLGKLLVKSGELTLAARHFVLAGAGKEADDLGKHINAYVDVTEFLAHPTHWIRAGALKMTAAEADLVPDTDVASIVEQALSTIDAIGNGEFKDSPLFGPHAYLAAYEVIAALGDRLTPEQATQTLDLLEPLTTVQAPGQYRHTDESHSRICARIGTSHGSHLQRASDQLLALLGRDSHGIGVDGRTFLVENISITYDKLSELAAAGNRVAAQLLAHARPEAITEEQMEAAAVSLAAPTSNTAGHYAVGSDAANQAVLAEGLPPARRAVLVRAQLDLCASPHELAWNRVDYLRAATILASNLAFEDASTLFEAVLPIAKEGIESDGDRSHNEFSHPLGAFRINGTPSDRPAAVFLLSRLANTPEEKRIALSLAAGLIGEGDDAEYWATFAIRELQDDVDDGTLQVLARQSWSLRSLAAIRWAKSDTLSSAMGELLATDPDPRVRRTLAEAVELAPATERTDRVREVLLADPRHSVRKLVSPVVSS